QRKRLLARMAADLVLDRTYADRAAHALRPRLRDGRYRHADRRCPRIRRPRGGRGGHGQAMKGFIAVALIISACLALALVLLLWGIGRDLNATDEEQD